MSVQVSLVEAWDGGTIAVSRVVIMNPQKKTGALSPGEGEDWEKHLKYTVLQNILWSRFPQLFFPFPLTLLFDQESITLFPGGSDGKASAYSAGDLGSIPGLGRSPGEGNGTPLQYSCLENPMDGGAWLATVHGVAKSRTQLRDFTITITIL